MSRMEKERGWKFKLYVPPRVNYGQVSTVQPQETVDFMNAFQQSYSTSMVAPTTSTRQDFPKMQVVPPMEKAKIDGNPGQLYSELFDEVEKIKCWKVQVDSDTVQKEQRLQDFKRTIETQRKAIHEMQFESESLSIKLEDQISENEDLRNKSNVTRNLCNILKDTFQRSAEKINLFECEREETHHLLIEKSESIQKLIAAFESLRIRAEADQQEMQKVKKELLQFEDLTEKCHQDYNMKEKEVAVLHTKLKDKENELQKVLLDLYESQKHCKQLQEAANKQYELLESSKAEQETLLKDLQTAEQHCKETEKNLDAISTTLEQSKEEYAAALENKDLKLEELSRVKNLQAEELEKIQTTLQEIQNSLALEIQKAKELENKLIASKTELERRETLLGEAMEQGAKKDCHIKILEEQLDKKSKSIDSMKVKVDVTDIRVEELNAELSKKIKEAQLLKDEAEVILAANDQLKNACEAAEKAQGDLKEKSKETEMKVQEMEDQLLTEKKRNDEYTFQMEKLRKDITQHEVKYNKLFSNFNELQSENTAIQKQCESGSFHVKTIEANMKMSEEEVVKLTRKTKILEDENQCLQGDINSFTTNINMEYLKSETLKKKIEENFEQLQEEMTKKEKEIKVMEKKLFNLKKCLETKLKAKEEHQKETKTLKKQIAKEMAKSSRLENVINRLHEESQNFQRLNEENHQKLLKDHESKSAFATELQNEVQHLRLAAEEAIKEKEDTELKCQHKIANMVTLMEKHKGQYDRIVEEKDAELDEKKKRETEAFANMKSLELDLERQNADNDKLKQQLNSEVADKENLQTELTNLKKEMSSMKITQLSEVKNKQSPASNHKQGRASGTPKESSLKRKIEFSRTKKTPSYSKGMAAFMTKTDSDLESIRKSVGTKPKTKVQDQGIHNIDLTTLRRIPNSFDGTSKIKSYRVRTPPSPLAGCLENNTIELEPKSDSSDQSDIFKFVCTPPPNLPASGCKLRILQKIRSPVSHKSPGNSLKLAAVKRMRDAGWAAVTGCDKKKKKSNEKIFA